MFFLLYRHADDGAFLTIFEDFPPLSQNFRRFSKIFPKVKRMFPNICRQFPKKFRSYTNDFEYSLKDKLDISEIIDIFTSEDMKNRSLESSM